VRKLSSIVHGWTLLTLYDKLPLARRAQENAGFNYPFLTLKERDNETGLDYFGARYYASTQGRFTSPDDFLNDTHVTSPASWNLYAYVRNNPLKYIDPLGQDVYSTNLTDKEKQELIDDWRKKTGYKSISMKSGPT
jgi:RHS repeat-associated protein